MRLDNITVRCVGVEQYKVQLEDRQVKWGTVLRCRGAIDKWQGVLNNTGYPQLDGQAAYVGDQTLTGYSLVLHDLLDERIV